MPRIAVILSLLLSSYAGKAQVVFKTIVQQTTVKTGESFHVEYMLENVDGEDVFTTPAFNNLKVVRGPDLYPGKVSDGVNTINVRNYVFTLVAYKPGRYVIPGATAKVNNRFIKSDHVVIEAVEKLAPADTESEYFLHPNEDPYEKMRKNLFMKVMVDKRSCYIGEPVVATFKLYSRLQSKSDIVKNPGFYGFSVQDIISLDNHISAIETINGKKFDVHTVRTVQLYPLQAGVFTIDPMEVLNKVEFSKSAVTKRTEQEIREGVHEYTEAESNHNLVTYENHISTEKIAITVKPYPEKNKPDTFSGATGRFTIEAILEKNNLAKNEEGDLLVIIEGKGNFTQLSAPSVQWPAGLEGFEAALKDSLDKTHVPLKGKRIFRFPFVAAKAGSYTIPAIAFPFFDIDSNKYKTVSTSAVEVTVTQLESKTTVTVTDAAQTGDHKWPVIPVAAIALVIIILAAWLLYRKRKPVAPPMRSETNTIPSLDQLFEPVYPALKTNDGRFYITLQKAIWDYLGQSLGLAGSKMNKYDLRRVMKEKNIPELHSQDILSILQECEAAAFTKAEFLHDKQELLLRARRALETLKA